MEKIKKTTTKEPLRYNFYLRFRCARCGKLRLSGGWYDVCRKCGEHLNEEE